MDWQSNATGGLWWFAGPWCVRCHGTVFSKTLQNWYVGTLDLEKAFDRADPALALKVLRHLGMDSKVVNLLLNVWGNQRRFLQYM